MFRQDFKARILQIYLNFPELQDRGINCGVIRKRGSLQGVAIGWTSPPSFRLRPNSSRYTIAHELTHLVQESGSGIPRGEVACDIWTIDRMSTENLDERPYYLLAGCKLDWHKSKTAVKGLCRKAIEQRMSSRTYIVWLRTQIKELESTSATP